MTALGKILVFVNLVFAVLTAGMIVMVYATRTNWAAGYEKMKQAVDVVRADARAAAEQSQLALEQKDKEVAARDKSITDLGGRVTALTQDVETAKTAASDADKRALAAQAQVTVQTQELQRLANERKLFSEKLQERDKQVLGLEGDVARLRNESVTNRIAYESAQQRNERLLVELENLRTENGTLRARLAPGGAAPQSVLAKKTPPPEDVRGRIKTFDPSSKLATITVGSDAGVSEGNVLQVYRLAPTPTYIGTLRILSTRPHEAVGRLDPAQARTTAQINDEVASRIVTGGPSGNGSRGGSR